MSYLILGAQGMLGEALSTLLGEDAVALSRDQADITNEQSIRQAIAQYHPDVIINTAAYNAVDLCEQDEAEQAKAQAINAEAPGMLAALCKEQGMVFVHYSTDYVFSGNTTQGYTEDAKTDPLSFYGKTKADGEKAVQEQGEKYYIIRLARLFGKQGSGTSAKKNFIDTMLWLATEGKKEHLDIVDTEIGSPTYAPDLAVFTKQLIDDAAPFGIYHGANEGECSWYELANTAFAVAGITVSTAPCGSDKYPRPAKRPVHATLINTKRPAQRHWKEAVREYVSSV